MCPAAVAFVHVLGLLGLYEFRCWSASKLLEGAAQMGCVDREGRTRGTGSVLQWARTWLCSLGGQNLVVLQHEPRAGSGPEALRALDQPEKFVVCEARSCLFIST